MRSIWLTQAEYSGWLDFPNLHLTPLAHLSSRLYTGCPYLVLTKSHVHDHWHKEIEKSSSSFRMFSSICSSLSRMLRDTFPLFHPHPSLHPTFSLLLLLLLLLLVFCICYRCCSRCCCRCIEIISRVPPFLQVSLASCNLSSCMWRAFIAPAVQLPVQLQLTLSRWVHSIGINFTLFGRRWEVLRRKAISLRTLCVTCIVHYIQYIVYCTVYNVKCAEVSRLLQK